VATQTKPAVGVAFVGAGNVTSGPYSHAIERCDAAQLVAVYDPITERAQELAARNGANAATSLEDLLADERTEAVVVAAPTAHQAPTAIACLEAGKHVLIEKPVSESAGQIDAMIAAADARGLVAMPAHNFIYQATLAKARAAVDQSRFGTLASVWVLYNLFHPEEVAARYVGVLRQIGTHLAYSLLYLAGRPESVTATSTSVHYEELALDDQVMLTCTMPGGALANLWASFAASDPTSDPWTVVFKLLGTRGGLTYSWNEAQFEDDGGPAWGVPSYMDGFATELEFFVREAVGAGRTPPSTLADARDALRILEAAERSLAADGARQTIDYS
jgi:predicted dehydrogenase